MLRDSTLAGLEWPDPVGQLDVVRGQPLPLDLDAHQIAACSAAPCRMSRSDTMISSRSRRSSTGSEHTEPGADDGRAIGLEPGHADARLDLERCEHAELIGDRLSRDDMSVDALGVVAVAAEVDRSGRRRSSCDRDAERERLLDGVGEALQDRVEVGPAACERGGADDAAAQMPLGHPHAAGGVAPRPAHPAVRGQHDLGGSTADVDDRDGTVRAHVGGDAGEGQRSLLLAASARARRSRAARSARAGRRGSRHRARRSSRPRSAARRPARRRGRRSRRGSRARARSRWRSTSRWHRRPRRAA